MDSKTRATLRKIANNIEPSVTVGKDGVTENVIKQLEMNLFAHELVKVSFVYGERDEHKEFFSMLCEKTGAEPICMIGKRCVVYKYSQKKGVKHILEVK